MLTSGVANARQPSLAHSAARVALWPIALAVLIGAGFRFFRLGANSLWADEFATLDLATRSPAEILHMSSSVNFVPPLYFLLVHGAGRIFGESEFGLRLLSAVAGIGTIPVVWLLTREITGKRSTATIASILLAVNPLHLWYSQEARPYALLLLFGCCTLLFLVRAVQTNSLGDWIGFTIAGALAFLTHTTGVLFVVIAWVWVLGTRERDRLIRPLLQASVAGALICTPFVLAIVRAFLATDWTFHSPPRSLTGLEVPYNVLTYVGGYSFGPAQREIQNLGWLAAVQSSPFQTVMLGAAVAALIVVAWINRRREMAAFIALFGVPLAGIFLLSALSGKAYNVRYTLAGLIGFLGVVSIAVTGLQLRQRATVATALIGLSLWADAQWFLVSRYWKEDSRAAVAWLWDELPPGSTVAVAPGYSTTPLAYYSRKAGAELRFLPASPGNQRAGVPLPDALVLTRLHHVPGWPALKASFVGQSGIRIGRVAGYEMLVRPGLQKPSATD